ncbi:MAG TPA: urease accessory protein UreE [Stellaceae bacterium]
MRRAVAVHPAGTWPHGDAVAGVTLAFLDRHRRRIRLVDDAGQSFLLDLPRAISLRDGDGLELDSGRFLLVRAAEEAVVEIAAPDAASLARIAWHLGNRHLPVQIVGQDRLRIRDDHVIVEMLKRLDAEIRSIRAPFDPEGGAYTGGGGRDHAHGHGDHHEHGHDHEH